MVHDHDAVMAMLARQAADDTEWDRPMVLFALGRNPDGAYGIAPTRPWNTYLFDLMNDHDLQGTQALAHVADVARQGPEALPGLDVARIAFNVCRENGQVRRYFPAISEDTAPCGMVLRTEAWSVRSTTTPLPPGLSVADHPEAVETLEWMAVTDDDHFMQVTWARGEAAPTFTALPWAAITEHDHNEIQHVAELLRTMMHANQQGARDQHDYDQGRQS